MILVSRAGASKLCKHISDDRMQRIHTVMHDHGMLPNEVHLLLPDLTISKIYKGLRMLRANGKAKAVRNRNGYITYVKVNTP